MHNFKRLIFVIVLIFIGLTDIFIYWNSHLYYKARRIGNAERKVQTLQRAYSVLPFNDLVYHELGKVYFEIATEDIANSEQRDANLQKSIQSFIRSIKLNPGYYQPHFHLAKSLMYQSYFSDVDIDIYDEYKKAANLTSFDRKAYFEVGRIFLSNWPDLSEQDRRFVVRILRDGIDSQEKLLNILQIWAINFTDYDFMEQILPREPDSLRLYAQFLGERGLSLEERQNKLARAEYLEFNSAKDGFIRGERAYRSYRMKDALSRYQFSMDMLMRIKFFQNLTDQKLIDHSKFKDLQKLLYLGLAKTFIQLSRSLDEAKAYLHSYLELEEDAAKLDELESYLKQRNLLSDEADFDAKDINPFYFQIILDFKLSRFRGIVKKVVGLTENFISPPEVFKKDWVKLLQIIGDSNQKVDFMYDAEKFYNKALEIEPYNLETLYSMRKNYVKLNDIEKAGEVDKKIENLLAPKDIVIENSLIPKGRVFQYSFILDGKKIYLSLHFQGRQSKNMPLVTISLNDKVIWENYLEGEIFSFTANSTVGMNTLKIVPVSQAVQLQKIEYSKDGFPQPEGFSGTMYEAKPREQALIDRFEEAESRKDSSKLDNKDIKEIEIIPKQKPSQIKVELEKPSYTQPVEQKDKSINLVSGLAYLKSIIRQRQDDSFVVDIQSDPFRSFNTFELADPNRIVIDFSGIDDIQNSRNIEINEFGIGVIKAGMFKYDTARIVFYLTGEMPHYSVERMDSGLRITFWQK